jgi:hypothetical protein
MIRTRIPFLLALVTLSPAAAAAPGEPPRRESTLLVYGEDDCPQSSDDEIVVCARRPEEERYRIPERLRQPTGRRHSEIGWGARSEELDEVQRDTRPGAGCSVVGPDGIAGCVGQLVRMWYADRRLRGRN